MDDRRNLLPTKCRRISKLVAYIVALYIIHSFDSTVKTLILILVLRDHYQASCSEVLEDLERKLLMYADDLQLRTTSQPPHNIHDSNSSSLEVSAENVTQQHNTHDGKKMKLPGEEILNELMPQSHVEDVTQEDVTKGHVTSENVSKEDINKQDDGLPPTVLITFSEDLSSSMKGSVLSQPTFDGLYFNDGKQEGDKKPKLNDNCLDDEEVDHSTTLSQDHTQPKSSSVESMGIESTSVSDHDVLEDVDLVSLESEESLATELSIDLRSSPLDEDNDDGDVRQQPRASTNEDRFSKVLQLYDALNKQLHMLSFIQGCVIGNERLQVFIKENSDLDICKNYILNAIEFDPGPGILSVDYVNVLQ